MPGFVRHVFICCNQRPPGNPRGCCADRGADAVREAFKVELKKAGAAEALGGPVRANLAGCLEQCELGVTVVVYPDGVWYGRVGVADVAEIVAEHVIAGRVVERLRIADRLLNDRAAATAAAAAGWPNAPTSV